MEDQCISHLGAMFAGTLCSSSCGQLDLATPDAASREDSTSLHSMQHSLHARAACLHEIVAREGNLRCTRRLAGVQMFDLRVALCFKKGDHVCSPRTLTNCKEATIVAFGCFKCIWAFQTLKLQKIVMSVKTD